MNRENANLRTAETKGKSTSEKIKEHKTGVFIAITAVVGTVLTGIIIHRKILIKHAIVISETTTDKLKTLESATSVLREEADQCIDTQIISQKLRNVCGHTRMLPDGFKPSQKQLDIANKLNITLYDKQTYVSEYKRNVA